MPSALARDFKVDISTDNTTWISLKGVEDLAPSENGNLQGADSYDTLGFSAFEKTMTGGKLVVKFYRNTTAGVPSDPAQAVLEATRFQFGTAARAYVRWYNRNGGTEAFSMLALVDWQQSKTGVADLMEVTVTLTADGVVSRISNPYAATAVPVITSVTPSGVSVGNLITINGQNFTGTVATTGVKVGATNATNWTVLSDNTIVATMPAGTAGASTVTVTNAIGASTAFTYTRGA